LVAADVSQTLEGTALEGAPIVPVSARTGQGLEELLVALQEMLAQVEPRRDRGRPRLPVDRVFTISGFGTVVTGTLTDGCFEVGQEIEVFTPLVYTMEKGFMIPFGALYLLSLGLALGVTIRMRETIEVAEAG
jgi:translation initiation factor 2 gamma subunit (eIF-2gamma)